jgi:L-serine dehydratase
VGCQGEVGVAAAMGAAMISYIEGCSIQVVENAAEIALEHQLGLTCDPIDGYVQIPCIERNAVGAVEAYNAYLLASSGDPKKQKITFDQVVEVMLQTGKDMCLKYKETSKGGLALCDIEC